MGIAAVYDEEYWREEFEHRAAILEYDGGLWRKDAEHEAGTWMVIERLRVTSEQVQRMAAKGGAVRTPKVDDRPAEQQATLPGLEMAYQGG